MKRKRVLPTILGSILATALTAGLTWSAPTSAAPDDDALAPALDNILANPRLDGALASVTIADAGTGETLYERMSNTRLRPASNTKLLTSSAAISLLGPDYTWNTQVLTAGKRTGGTLEGNLYLRGTGDPTLLVQNLDALAAKVAANGITRVNGDLVADDTRFDSQRLADWPAQWETWMPQISALTLNADTNYQNGAVAVITTPGPKLGDPAAVKMTPANHYLKLDVRAKTVAKNQPNTLSVERTHGTNTIVISGNVPLQADTDKQWVTVWEPAGYTASVFRDKLAAHGIQVTGGTRFGEATPHRAKSIATHRSMPLSKVIIPFMKFSNNGQGEMLIKTMGYETVKSGSWDAGLKAIRGYLEKTGVDTSTLLQGDGSGASISTKVPSAQFAKLLHHAQNKPWFKDWYKSLPIACDNDRMTGGTLQTRMCNTPAAGNVHAKTGTLDDISALSGYVTAADGRKLIFSIVLNNFLGGYEKMKDIKDVEDKIAITLASYKQGTDSVPTPAATR